ncbi:MAG: hypothetical protein RLZZ175_874 [Bacteroidota bacterium]|jgi:23S rRNA (cytosine1962-C5)-methyltransferase
MGYSVLKLAKGREKAIVNRHHWIFSGAVATLPEVPNGEMVEVKDASGKTLGYGFFSTHSQITCRMFHFGVTEKPVFDLAYWQHKINLAVEKRKAWIDLNITNTYRLIHAEGDFFPGLVVDVYNDILVIQVGIKGIERILQTLVKAFNNEGFKNVYLKYTPHKQNIEKLELKQGWLSVEDKKKKTVVQVIENRIKFEVDIENGQKTGFFIDQRDNRAYVKRFAKGKTVLNCFSYTGGFSVYALAGAAKSVTSVDISEDAMKDARKNGKLNGFDANHETVVADCFDYLRNAPENHFDMIILDPPAFAKNANAVKNASLGYKDINLQALKMIKPGGFLFTYSCSQHIDADLFQKIIFAAAADSGRNVQIIHKLLQSVDHPVNIFHPEGEYLKGLVLWVE